ncbi:hypothetical protein Tco_1238906 [Tanacetum coccineum]
MIECTHRGILPVSTRLPHGHGLTMTEIRLNRIGIDRLPEPVNFSYAGYIAYQDIGKDECLAPGDDIEILLHHDPFTPMKSITSILEGLIDDPPFEENDDLFDLEC